MSKYTKLELTWVDKDKVPSPEPRIMLEDSELSYYSRKASAQQSFENRLIQGDNLLALKALDHEFAGKIKCVCIDPPYNTGSAFPHYEDGIEHSLWLNMMRDRLELLRNLMADDGSIWITIDDHEMPYLRILLDEIFGRSNFIAQVIWQKVYSPKSSAQYLSDMHDYVVAYAKNLPNWKRNLLPRSEKQNRAYKNLDNDARGLWKASDLSARNYYGEGRYPITCPSGRVIPGPPQGMYWRVSPRKFAEMDADNRIWWGKGGNNVPAIKRFLSEVQDGIVPQTIWLHEEVGHNQAAKQHLKKLLPDIEDLFVTPKPEGLIQRVLQIATMPGDWVLDSFAGTGTTGTAAHKMGRPWILIESGDHCLTHIVPRLRQVLDGTDDGGISESEDWHGGGGFRFYRLAPSLLERDKWDNWVISKQYNPTMLAEAMCKLEGFTYAPSQEHYWQQGYSTERDFIYVTTQKLTPKQLHALSEDVGPDRSLLVCCTAFRGSADQFQNLNLKKIPKMVVERCEWGRDDYSLAISNLPAAPPTDDEEPAPTTKKSTRTKKAAGVGQAEMFPAGGEKQ